MINGKSVLCVIPARGGSVGIKNKNLQKVHEVSLVSWASKLASSISIIDKVIVSTDSQEIADEAQSYGADFLSFRPSELSGASVHDQQVLIHSLFESESFCDKEFDVIVMLQPTSPLRSREEVEECLRAVAENGKSACWTVSEIDLKFHYRKQLKIGADDALELAFSGDRVVARQELQKVFMRNGACYVFSRDTLMNDPNLLGTNCGYLISNGIRPNIDNIEDLEWCRNISQVNSATGYLTERQ
jgi:CMP-N,N'-diacetyllegionaminic acid synthase